MSGPPQSPLRPSPTLHLASLLVPLAVALWAGWDLLAPWDVDGHSVYLNHIRLVALDATLREGGTTLRWLPQLYFGHGSPLFHYLAPLPTLIALALHGLGFDAGAAIKAVYLLSLLGMALTTSWLARALAGPWAGLAAGALVVLAPYTLVDVYVRAQLGEPLALALAPLVLLAVHSLDGARPWRAVVLGGLALAGVVLSHNIAALMLCALMAAAVVARALQGPWRPVALRGTAMLLLGLGLSAWFWLPAVTEIGLVQARESLTGGPLAHDQHFVTVAQLLDDAWGYGTSGPGDQDRLPLQAGRAHLLLWLVAGGLALRHRRGIAALTWLLLATAPLALWLTTASSAWLWRALPLMPYVQFPWRFLLLFALAAAVAGGLVFSSLAAALRPSWRTPVLSVLVGLLVVASQHQVHARYLKYNLATGQSAVFEKRNGPRVDQEPDLVGLDRVYTAARLRERGTTATIGDEYLPRSVVDKPRAPAARPVEVIAGSVQILSIESLPHRHRARLRVESPARLRWPLFVFSGWVARVDGQQVTAAAETRSGLLLVEVPAGEHELVLQFETTPRRTAAGLTTLLSALAAVLLLGWSMRRPRQPLPRRAPAP